MSEPTATGAVPGRGTYPPGYLIYRTKDGTSYFHFQCEPHEEEGIRIYIVQQPEGRTDGCHILKADDRPYVCWSGTIPDMGAARAIAREWSERELCYLRDGVTF